MSTEELMEENNGNHIFLKKNSSRTRSNLSYLLTYMQDFVFGQNSQDSLSSDVILVHPVKNTREGGLMFCFTIYAFPLWYVILRREIHFAALKENKVTLLCFLAEIPASIKKIAWVSKGLFTVRKDQIFFRHEIEIEKLS